MKRISVDFSTIPFAPNDSFLVNNLNSQYSMKNISVFISYSHYTCSTIVWTAVRNANTKFESHSNPVNIIALDSTCICVGVKCLGWINTK